MANQRRIWSDEAVVAARRAVAEEAMRRSMEMPGREYSEEEQATARAHLERVANGRPALVLVEAEPKAKAS